MSNPQKAKGSRLEQRILREAQRKGLRAKKQPLSGILKEYPNDVQVENTLIEAKAGYTRLNADGQKIFSLNVEWLSKVAENASRLDFESGLLVIRPDGTTQAYVIMRLDFALELLKTHEQTT